MKYPEDFISKVIQGDCLEVMKQIPDKSIDLVLTDPPYGIDYQSSRTIDWRRKEKIANDDRPFTDFIPEAYRVTKEGGVILCFTRYDVESDFKIELERAGFATKGQIIWDKVAHGMGDLNGDVAPRHENIIFATKGKFNFPGKRPTSVMKFQRVTPEKLDHPNEKPNDLLGHLIEHFVGDGVILDCFAGSGSTLRAAKLAGRKYIGIEISERYCKIAEERLRQDVLL